MNFYNDKKEQKIPYFHENWEYRKKDTAMGRGLVYKAAKNYGDYQQGISTTAFVSHYDKASSDNCLETNSSRSYGRGPLLLKNHNSLSSESSSSNIYGKGGSKKGFSRNFTRNVVARNNFMYRPSYRLWKKCSATYAKTVTSVFDLYEMNEPKCYGEGDAIDTGKQVLQQTIQDALQTSNDATESYYIVKSRENRSHLPMSPSWTTNENPRNASPLMEDKSTAISRATNAAFEAILPYISFEEAQALRDIITTQSPSVSLNAVIQAAQNCKKTSNRHTMYEKETLQKVVEGSSERNHTFEYNTMGKRLSKEQDTLHADVSISPLSTWEVVPTNSPSVASSVGSSASEPVETVSNTWVSPFLRNHSLEPFNEPWDIEHCVSEMEELDLLGKTLHEEAGSSVDHRLYYRRSRFFPMTENGSHMDSNGQSEDVHNA